MLDVQKLKVYLSFPIANAGPETQRVINGLANDIEQIFPEIKIHNPLDNQNSPTLRTDDGVAKIVNDDICMMNVSDVLLAVYTVPSVGQSMEIFYFNRCQKPVYVLFDETNWIRYHDAKFKVSAWLIHHMKKCFLMNNWKFAIREIIGENRK